MNSQATTWLIGYRLRTAFTGQLCPLFVFTTDEYNYLSYGIFHFSSYLFQQDYSMDFRELLERDTSIKTTNYVRFYFVSDSAFSRMSVSRCGRRLRWVCLTFVLRHTVNRLYRPWKQTKLLWYCTQIDQRASDWQWLKAECESLKIAPIKCGRRQGKDWTTLCGVCWIPSRKG